MMKVTVIGAGNGGLTAAYVLAKNGNEVCIYDSPKFPAQVNAVEEKGGITALSEDNGMKMLFPGVERIALSTTDIEKAMGFSDTFMMVCPSFAQEIMFSAMLPYVKDGMKIFIIPGNYGGLVLNKMLQNSDKRETDITFIDTISLPWATRAVDAGTISIMGVKEFMPLSIFPKAKQTEDMIKFVRGIFPTPVEILENPVVAALENINFGAHPLFTILNMGLLENFEGGYNFYRDCCSPSIAKVEDALDRERLTVGESLHLHLRTELEAMNALYASDCSSIYEFNRGSSAHGKIKNAPANSKNRYITEDIPYLFVPFCELAKICGVQVPAAEALITLANLYNDVDYRKTGRTLEKIGFNHWTKQEILEFLQV